MTRAGYVQTIPGVARELVADPSRGDIVSAWRATRTLALAERVSALYMWACPRCGGIRDQASSGNCCTVVRPALAVAPVGYQPRYPAPLPARAPVWVANAAPLVQLPGRLATGDMQDVLTAIIRRGHERLLSGDLTVNSADLVAALRLQLQLEDADRRDGAGIAAAQAALTQVLDLARGYLGDRFGAFLRDVYAAPVFQRGA